MLILGLIILMLLGWACAVVFFLGGRLWRDRALNAELLLWDFMPDQMNEVHGSRDIWAHKYHMPQI